LVLLSARTAPGRLGWNDPAKSDGGSVPDRARVPAQRRRPGAAAWALLLAMLAAGLLGAVDAAPVGARDATRRDQVRFMWAMAGQESGWDYYARNASSGAFGKYQIMPFNWPVWAAQYLGDRRADQTPWNQEMVATGKLRDLYGWLGTWKRVAYWWLTGRTDRDERRWSGYARGYVENIMRLRAQAPADAGDLPVRTSSRAGRGDWRLAAQAVRLRLRPGGSPWRRGGRIREGEVVWVHRATTRGERVRWIAVTTQDGRFGWLPQARSLPAERPPRGRAWRDIRDRGGASEASDRRLARPRPR
jgi:hypothetical protein